MLHSRAKCQHCTTLGHPALIEHLHKCYHKLFLLICKCFWMRKATIPTSTHTWVAHSIETPGRRSSSMFDIWTFGAQGIKSFGQRLWVDITVNHIEKAYTWGYFCHFYVFFSGQHLLLETLSKRLRLWSRIGWEYEQVGKGGLLISKEKVGVSTLDSLII